MPQFAFEIAGHEGPPTLAYELNLPEDRDALRHALFLACKHRDGLVSHIAVKDQNGDLIIRTGIRTALASMQKYHQADCPVP